MDTSLEAALCLSVSLSLLVAFQLLPGLVGSHLCSRLPVLVPLSLVYPKLFSRCSEQDMWQFLGDPRTSCLLNVPRADELYGGPVCGNQFVERGEQCDCGTLEVGMPSESPGDRWVAETWDLSFRFGKGI